MIDDQTTSARRRPRGVFLVPAALTVANIFLGYFAIVKSFQGDHGLAALMILVAIILDKLDGMAARATGTVSDFGRELDSLADVVTFGVAPAILSLSWGLSSLGKVGWVVCFFFLMCGALRLARFNVQSSSGDRRWFVGLPIPMAAALPASLIFAHGRVAERPVPLDAVGWSWGFLALLASVSFLMVSRVRYFSFKDVRFGRQQRLLVILGLVALIAAIGAWPGPVLVLICVSYVAHGPVLKLASLMTARRGEEGRGPGLRAVAEQSRSDSGTTSDATAAGAGTDQS